MRKILGFGLALLMLLIVVSVFPVSVAENPNARGPTEKATGEVLYLISERAGVDVRFFYKFNAHEGKDDPLLGKGYLMWNGTNPDSSLFRKMEIEVKYVNVDGNEAWFAGECTLDTRGIRVGDWLFMHVTDDATPGGHEPYDKIHGDWFVNENDAMNAVDNQAIPVQASMNVIDGNLVVHTYD